jgi:hypothetical protein
MPINVGKNLSGGQQPMTRRIVLLALLLVITVAVPSFAHGPMRYVGVVTNVDNNVITLQTVEGKSLRFEIHKDTQIRRNKKPAKLSDVKVNSTVVLDGRGDAYRNFRLREIDLVPPITAKQK